MQNTKLVADKIKTILRRAVFHAALMPVQTIEK